MEMIVGIALVLFMAGIVVAGVSRRLSDREFGGGMVAVGILMLVSVQLAVSTG